MAGLYDLMFITYRIMPFIMISFLVIMSLFSGDISGFFVLLGLIISSLITILISKTQSIGATIDSEKLLKCNLVTIGGTMLSNLPLSIHTFAYIFFYFIYVTWVNKSMPSNVLLLGLLGTILGIDMLFNYKNCAGAMSFIPLIIGGLSGVAWAVMIGSGYHMVPKSSNIGARCDVKEKKFNCKVKRTILNS